MRLITQWLGLVKLGAGVGHADLQRGARQARLDQQAVAYDVNRDLSLSNPREHALLATQGGHLPWARTRVGKAVRCLSWASRHA